jgi:hypothetical protein
MKKLTRGRFERTTALQFLSPRHSLHGLSLYLAKKARAQRLELFLIGAGVEKPKRRSDAAQQRIAVLGREASADDLTVTP